MWRYDFRPSPPKKLTPHAAALWRRSYEALLAFIKREGHARVPSRHHEGERALGRWVAWQRTKWREGRLLDEHKELLDAVPSWEWGREGMAQMPEEEEPRRGGHEFNFIVCGDDWRLFLTYGALAGLGAMPRCEAVIEMTKMALQNEFVPERHLREGGRMDWLVNRAFDEGLRRGNLDQPRPDYIRAVIREASALDPDDWLICIRAANIETPIARGEVIRLALGQAVEIFGVSQSTIKKPYSLEFLHEALDRMIEAGEIEIADH